MRQLPDYCNSLQSLDLVDLLSKIKDKESEINQLMVENISKMIRLKLSYNNFCETYFLPDYIEANNSLMVISKKIECRNGKIADKF